MLAPLDFVEIAARQLDHAQRALWVEIKRARAAGASEVALAEIAGMSRTTLRRRLDDEDQD